jgi:hypothetical protein
MRRVTLALALIAFAAFAGTAYASVPRVLEGDGSTLQLRNGRGTAVINSGSGSGSTLGAVARGKIVVVDATRGANTTVALSGCEEVRRPTAQKTVCIGTGLGFTIVGGIWRVTLQGRGIAASAVAQGWVRLRGTRGTYSINGSRFRAWPRATRTFTLP